MLKTALLCGALLFANGEAPIETPTEPEIIEPNAGEETEPTTPNEEETTPNVEEDKPVEIPTPDDVKNTVEDWLSQWLAPETIIALGSWLTFLSTALVFVVKWFKDRKKQNMNNEQLEKDITKIMETEIGKQIQEQFNKVAPELLASSKNVVDIMKVMSKILCLAQENTPKSRLAIIELIQSLGVVEQQNIDASKKVVEAKEKSDIEKAENTKKEIDKIIEETEKKDDGTTI